MADTTENTEVKDTSKEVKTKENPLGKPKVWSLVSKILGGVIILAGHILKWTGILPNASSSEICACGFSIMGVFGTIDINMAIDKFTKEK